VGCARRERRGATWRSPFPAAGGVVAGAIWMITHMDASSGSQAGDIFVVVGVLVAFACIAGMYISIEMRLKK
jgi:hypothetical protein